MSRTSSAAQSAQLAPALDERPVVASIVDQAPPLTEATKSRLAALLRPSSGDTFLDAVRGTLGGAA